MRVVGTQHRLAEVLHPGSFGMGVVSHGAGYDLGDLSAGEPQELVDLVTGDVGEDSSRALPVIEPAGTPLTSSEVSAVTFTMRSESESLHHLTDPPFADELAGPGHTAHLEPLGEGDCPDAAGRVHRLLDLVKLLKAHAPGLIGHDVLAVGEGLNGDTRALVRDSRGDDQIDGWVMQKASGVIDPRRVGPALTTGLGDGAVRFIGAEAHQLATFTQQPIDLIEGVRVVQADGGESDGATTLGLAGHLMIIPFDWAACLGALLDDRAGDGPIRGCAGSYTTLRICAEARH